MLNKPIGYLSSNVDEVYPSVLNLFPLKYRRLGLNVAGRLDQDTTGLLLVTMMEFYCITSSLPIRKSIRLIQ